MTPTAPNNMNHICEPYQYIDQQVQRAVSCLQQVWPIRQICRDLVRKVYRTSLEQINWKIALTTSHFRLFCFVQNNFAKKFSESKRKSNCSPSALFFILRKIWLNNTFLYGTKNWEESLTKALFSLSRNILKVARGKCIIIFFLAQTVSIL